MKPRTTKPKYTYLGIRPPQAIESRLRKLCKVMTQQLNRRVTISEIILTCLNSKLPEIESKHSKMGVKVE